LLAVPVFYSLFDDMKNLRVFQRLLGRKRVPAPVLQGERA